MKPPFKFSWELVTPAIAREMLTHNPKKQNRNLRETSVRAFAADMTNGTWSPSHQGIAFAIGGRLIDGQHRLAALVRSGMSIPFLICRDVPERVEGVKANVMDTLDRGSTRSISDVLKLSHGQTANPLIVAGICAMIPRIIVYHLKGSHEDRRTKKVTLHQTLAVLDLYKKSLRFIAENSPVAAVLRGAPIGAAVAIAHAVAPEETEKFYKLFATGAGISADSPVLSIRNHCLNEPLGKGGSRLDRLTMSMRVLQALAAFITGKRVGSYLSAEIRKASAEYFIGKQPKNVTAIERIFPTLEVAAQVVTAANWKPSPAAERLLASKAMSERIHGKGAGRVAKMQQRINRGEIKGAAK